MTTKLPALPKSARNLADLDALIDQSIGKPDIAEIQVPLQPDRPATDSSQSWSPKDGPKEVPQQGAQRGQGTAPPKLERLQVKVSDEVLLAMKVEALKQRRSPSAIVELALRQFLNLTDQT